MQERVARGATVSQRCVENMKKSKLGAGLHSAETRGQEASQQGSPATPTLRRAAGSPSLAASWEGSRGTCCLGPDQQLWIQNYPSGSQLPEAQPITGSGFHEHISLNASHACLHEYVSSL